jgi:importin subunit beta-1
LCSAYEAINVLIYTAAADSYPIISQMIGTLMARLKGTFLMQGLTGDEREKQNEIQALLCGSLQVFIKMRFSCNCHSMNEWMTD